MTYTLTAYNSIITMETLAIAGNKCGIKHSSTVSMQFWWRNNTWRKKLYIYLQNMHIKRHCWHTLPRRLSGTSINWGQFMSNATW